MLVRNFRNTIHQIWFQKPESEAAHGTVTNPEYKKYQQSYIDYAEQQGWEYILWDEDKVDKLVKRHFRNYYTAFNELESVIKKVDCARLMILYVYGGVYVDMDSYLKRGLHEFLDLKHIFREDYPYTAWHIAPKMNLQENYDIIVGQEKTIFEYYYNKFGIGIPKLNNAVIFAGRRLPIFKRILELGFQRKCNSILNSFGVHTFSLALLDEMSYGVNKLLDKDDYRQRASILAVPPVYFYEIDVDMDEEQWKFFGGDPTRRHSPNQFIVHKYDGNWDQSDYKDNYISSYGQFLENELDNENLDGTGSFV